MTRSGAAITLSRLAILFSSLSLSLLLLPTPLKVTSTSGRLRPPQPSLPLKLLPHLLMTLFVLPALASSNLAPTVSEAAASLMPAPTLRVSALIPSSDLILPSALPVLVSSSPVQTASVDAARPTLAPTALVSALPSPSAPTLLSALLEPASSNLAPTVSVVAARAMPVVRRSLSAPPL